MDKVQKIREEVARIQLYTQSEVLKQVLDYIDKVQKEPVSNIDFEQELYKAFGQVKDFTLGMQIAKRFYNMGRFDAHIQDGDKIVTNEEGARVNLSRLKRVARRDQRFCMYSKDNYTDEDRKVLCDGCKEDCKFNKKEEPVSEDLGEYINKLSKQFPEVSFAMLSGIADMVSRWQRNQDAKNKLPKVINRTDLDEFAYQCAYDLSNDWAIDNPTWHDVEDACKLGAKWQKEQDQSTIELAEDHAMLAGMEKMKEEMMANAIEGKVLVNGMGNPILHLWDKGRHLIDKKVKVIVIKEN